MPDALHQRLLALLAARPELALALRSSARPEHSPELPGPWIVRIADNNLRAPQLRGKDRHLLADLIITLHPPNQPEAPPVYVFVVECQLSVDREKLYTWVEYLASARRTFAAPAEVLVLSPVDRIVTWVRDLFAGEPRLRPIVVGRDAVPIVDDPRRALRNPELAVLSAVFHGDSEHGDAVLRAAAHAMKALPPARRREYRMLLEDALPEDEMDDIRKRTDEQAQAAADAWLRSRGPYQIGHREGLEQGLEQGLHRALALLLELRGLIPTAAEQARIDACSDPADLDRWCERAKTAGRVADLFGP